MISILLFALMVLKVFMVVTVLMVLFWYGIPIVYGNHGIQCVHGIHGCSISKSSNKQMMYIGGIIELCNPSCSLIFLLTHLSFFSSKKLDSFNKEA